MAERQPEEHVEHELSEERQGFHFKYSPEGYESDDEGSASPELETAERGPGLPFDFYQEHERCYDASHASSMCPEDEIPDDDANLIKMDLPAATKSEQKEQNLKPCKGDSLRLHRCSSRFALSEDHCLYRLVDPAAQRWEQVATKVDFRDASARDGSCVFALGLQDYSLYRYCPDQCKSKDENFIKVTNSAQLHIHQICAVDSNECMCVTREGDVHMFDGRRFIKFGTNARLVCASQNEIYVIGKDNVLRRLREGRRWEEIRVPTLSDIGIGSDDTLYGITAGDHKIARINVPGEARGSYSAERVSEEERSHVTSTISFQTHRPTLTVDRDGKIRK